MFPNADIEQFEYEDGFLQGQQARLVHKEFIDATLERYERRKQGGLPDIVPMFGGHGRSGKDEAALALKTMGWKFETSMSQVCLPLIALDRKESEEVAFRERHEHRHFWRGWYDGLRDVDPTVLVRMTLASNDMLVGIRSKKEFLACREAELFNLAVWVNRPGIPVDPTLEYAEEDCDCTLLNSRGLVEWHQCVSNFMTRVLV